MTKNNAVIFNGRKDGIIILLDNEVPFKEICDVLTMKMSEARDFFRDGRSAITFRGRDMSEVQEQELLDIIASQSDLSITFAQSAGLGYNPIESNARPVATEKVNTEHEETLTKTITTFNENPTMYKTESMRSGQSVRYAGSVVVMGDVNPGAEVIAEGNVIVMGKLLGLAHAGSSGVPGCFVSAIRMQPTQLRIGDIATYFPKSFAKDDLYSRRPLYAFVKDEQIHIEPLM